jgi:hypothetical protein
LFEVETLDAPLYILANINAWIWIALIFGLCTFLAWTRHCQRAHAATWSCGYNRPTARIQYTGASFAEMMAEHLLPRFLRPKPKGQALGGLFPPKTSFAIACPDPFNEKVYEPFFLGWAKRFARLRILQQGKVHVYMAYIVFIVVMALAWVSLRTWWAAS